MVNQSPGDKVSLENLFCEHRSRLLRMVTRRIDKRLAVRIDPEEILNDTFLVAQRRFHGFNQGSTVAGYAWLYRLVLDTLIEAWRRETRGRRDICKDLPWPSESSVAMGMQLCASETTPSEVLDREQLRDRMRAVVEQLSDADQEMLWMRHYDELGRAEIAEILGLKVDAVDMRYYRALKKLRSLWNRLHGDGEAP